MTYCVLMLQKLSISVRESMTTEQCKDRRMKSKQTTGSQNRGTAEKEGRVFLEVNTLLGLRFGQNQGIAILLIHALLCLSRDLLDYCQQVAHYQSAKQALPILPTFAVRDVNKTLLLILCYLSLFVIVLQTCNLKKYIVLIY